MAKSTTDYLNTHPIVTNFLLKQHLKGTDYKYTEIIIDASHNNRIKLKYKEKYFWHTKEIIFDVDEDSQETQLYKYMRSLGLFPKEVYEVKIILKRNSSVSFGFKQFDADEFKVKKIELEKID